MPFSAFEPYWQLARDSSVGRAYCGSSDFCAHPLQLSPKHNRKNRHSLRRYLRTTLELGSKLPQRISPTQEVSERSIVLKPRRILPGQYERQLCYSRVGYKTR